MRRQPRIDAEPINPPVTACVMLNGAPTGTYISGTTRRFFSADTGCYVANAQVGVVLTTICKK